VLILEPPSDSTVKAKMAAEEKSLHAPASDMSYLESPKSPDIPRRKKKGPKGPNPLSVKRKKVKPSTNKSEQTSSGNIVTTKRAGDGNVVATKRRRDADDADSQPTSRRKRARKSRPVISETTI
jgi:U3 small nucleolar RNA-associated protein 23